MDNIKTAILRIKVIPNSSREQIVGWIGDVLKIKLQAPAQDGKANEALKRLLSTFLNTNQKSIIIEQGECSPEKKVRIVGMDLESIKTINFTQNKKSSRGI